MSTFGKKYLNYWPYHFENLPEMRNRWNRTKKEFQLEILKKWFPIGMTGRGFLLGSKASGNLVEITGYTEFMYGWKLDVDYVGENYRKEVHPINFTPEEVDRLRILRELKLNKLLD